MPSECAVHGQARAKRGNLARGECMDRSQMGVTVSSFFFSRRALFSHAEVEQREMVRRVQESQRQELEK